MDETRQKLFELYCELTQAVLLEVQSNSRVKYNNWEHVQITIAMLGLTKDYTEWRRENR